MIQSVSIKSAATGVVHCSELAHLKSCDIIVCAISSLIIIITKRLAHNLQEVVGEWQIFTPTTFQ